MKELLKEAIKYDKRTGQPHCDKPEKVALLKQIAKQFDIKLDELEETPQKQTKGKKIA